ncbi:hypothetical protein QAD02_019271 [Eretmocerus hayati]|uniref:Uncharacterized protein n=1 Tax=Eretmocerus hayati TaxID=131215 RepID=A0ACC2PLL1_9HYME|nr:hypothetical protein QAD02_019271 [Eretmocerus hayati]
MVNNYTSVLVSHKTLDSSGGTFGTSGILLSSGWILAHGSLLSPNFFNEKFTHDVCDFLVDNQNQLEQSLLPFPRKIFDTVELRVHLNKSENGTRKESSKSQSKMMDEKDCTVKFTWRCPLLRKTFNDVFFSWSFEKNTRFDKSLLPIFLLIRIDDGVGSEGCEDSAEQVLRELYESLVSLSPKSRGLDVEIESAPFGNPCFLNSVSRGIVSNVLGEGNCIILSDVNAVPGCEGAPLFLLPKSRYSEEKKHQQENQARRICGLVIAPLSWCRGEWVDFAFAANLSVCLRKILESTDKGCKRASDTVIVSDAISNCAIRPRLLLPDNLDKSVVLVECGSDWGTGVIVDVATGTLLTCSHVVSKQATATTRTAAAAAATSTSNEKEDTTNTNTSRVRVKLMSNDDHEDETWARIVYKTDQRQPYDVAVLRLLEQSKSQAWNQMQTMKLASRNPTKGNSVLIWGYPLLGSDAQPSCSQGIVSRVNDCVIQTTCCVQSGSSGAPVIDAKSGELLGIVVSNAIVSPTTGIPQNLLHNSSSPFPQPNTNNMDSSILYPRFNMAVPIASVIRQPLMQYLATNDEKYLQSLATDNPIVQQMWNFHLTPRSKM